MGFCLFRFLCAAPCRRSMPLRRRTGRAANREKSSLLDLSILLPEVPDVIQKSIKMHKITDVDKFIIAIIEISNKKKIYRRWSYEDFGL